MDLQFALRFLIFRLRFYRDWTLLKLKCYLIQIQLWRLELEIAVLIAAKRLIQRIGGGENG